MSDLNTSSRVVKRVMRLQEYSFKIEYMLGKKNICADALSRIPWHLESKADLITHKPVTIDSSDTENDPSDMSDHECVDALLAIPALYNDGQLTPEEISKEQHLDPALSVIFDWAENAKAPTEQELASSLRFSEFMLPCFHLFPLLKIP